MAESAAVGDRVKEMKRVGSGRISNGRRHRKGNKKIGSSGIGSEGRQDNVM